MKNKLKIVLMVFETMGTVAGIIGGVMNIVDLFKMASKMKKSMSNVDINVDTNMKEVEECPLVCVEPDNVVDFKEV